MADFLVLGLPEVAAAAILYGILILADLALRQRRAGHMAWSATRMVVQLFVLGLLLKGIFSLTQAWPVLLIGLGMASVAAVAAVRRTRFRYRGIYTVSWTAVILSLTVVCGLALTLVIKPRNWWEPRFLIPILGMILGNIMNAVALALDRLLASLTDHRRRIENDLALGASFSEALADDIRDAVRTGMLPILNSMAVMGLVSLPGMMTGQILAGVDPGQAVRYQIVIVLVIASGIFLAVTLAVRWSVRLLFEKEGTLRPGTLRVLPQ